MIYIGDKLIDRGLVLLMKETKESIGKVQNKIDETNNKLYTATQELKSLEETKQQKLNSIEVLELNLKTLSRQKDDLVDQIERINDMKVFGIENKTR